MSGTLTFLTVAIPLAAGSFAVHRLWLRANAAGRLETEDAARDLAPPRTLPAIVPAILVGSLVAAIAYLGLGASIPLAGAGACDVGALVYVAFAIRARGRELRAEQQLGDALRLMTAAVRAGSSPNAALERAAAQVGAPIGPQLAEAAGRLRLGEDAREVLGALARESRLDSLRLFSQALAVQWRAGGSLQHTLTTVGKFVRDRVELQRRIESQVAPTRSSVLILAGATVAVGFLSWSNDPLNVERFVASPVGQTALVLCLLLQGLSFVWMWRLSELDR